MSLNDRRRAGAASVVAGLVLLVAGCTQQMANQPSYRPYQASSFFADGMSARPQPPDTVALGNLRDDGLLFTGRDASGQESTQFPFPVDHDVLDRGRQRYDIDCAPCHGYAGYGNGMVVQRGFSPPPSFHSDRLRQAPVGHFYDVITSGFGAMPSYADQISVVDRWAIVAYIRALQLSQNAPVSDVPADALRQLEQP